MTRILKAPFPQFGGKSAVAAEVWARFGDVGNFVEPFAGSLAVLMGRPHPRGIETVNDLNGWLTNFWRALAADPEGVARAADWPVSELDLHSRGDWLFYRAGVDEWVERLRADPDFYDVKSAGWWAWGQSSWIGDNWGRKDCRSIPHLGNAGQGVNRQLPHLSDAGKGVNRQLPHLGNAGRGEADLEPPTVTPRTHDLIAYFRQLAARLRGVRVCCGDWARVCGPSVTTKLGLTGVFLDPPYAAAGRDSVYGEHESFTVAHDVREWAVAQGENPLMRIALCGYDEHDGAMPPGWTRFAWKTSGGYGSQNRRGNANAERETIFFSPNCLNPAREMALEFEEER